MITTIDEATGEVVVRTREAEQRYALSSPEGFAAVSRAWLRASWDAKYAYTFTWLGRPIIQLPEDLVRIQEVIYSLKPSVLIETGVAHGGSLAFYASLLKLIDHGRVIGVDFDIRPDNRRAIEAHELYPLITLIEASSIDPDAVARVRELVKPSDKVMVVLDSNHSYEHVLAELELYAPLVSLGSYIVVCDAIIERLVGAPRTMPDWETNNPRHAACDFTRGNRDFVRGAQMALQ